MSQSPFEGSPRSHDSVVVPNVQFRTRDGVTLAADLYLPALNGKAVDGSFPTLLERTPYLKDSIRSARRGHWYARRG